MTYTNYFWGLSPQWTSNYKDGKLKSIGGDGLIMFVCFAKNSLPKIESTNMYGARAYPNSKHFNDQVEMYLKQQTKTISLDKKRFIEQRRGLIIQIKTEPLLT